LIFQLRVYHYEKKISFDNDDCYVLDKHSKPYVPHRSRKRCNV